MCYIRLVDGISVHVAIRSLQVIQDDLVVFLRLIAIEKQNLKKRDPFPNNKDRISLDTQLPQIFESVQLLYNFYAGYFVMAYVQGSELMTGLVKGFDFKRFDAIVGQVKLD